MWNDTAMQLNPNLRGVLRFVGIGHSITATVQLTAGMLVMADVVVLLAAVEHDDSEWLQMANSGAICAGHSH